MTALSAKEIIWYPSVRRPNLPSDVTGPSPGLISTVERKIVHRHSEHPIALFLTGSSVVEESAPRDFDFVLVEQGQYKQQFYSIEVDGMTVEVDVWQESIFSSNLENYYWNPDKLVAEIGKLANCKSVATYSESESVEQTLAIARDVPTEIRLFILSYHLGVLGYRTDGTAPNVVYNPAWSVISCLAAIEDRYPPSLRADIVRELFDTPDLPIEHSESDGRMQITSTDEAISRVVERVSEPLSSALRDVSAPTDIPLYYPQNLKGFHLLGVSFDETGVEDVIECRKRY